ncbi:MAG: non-hydrolyzing UDP-N-acetylglucosamine 2-epimerase [Pseudomonadales bacterium]
MAQFKKIIHVVGARPNYMKIAPVYRALEAAGGVEQILVHTGQHYSPEMSTHFFDELGMPRPDVNLNVGSGSHAEQTGRIMQAFEPVLLEHKPDLVIVVGDVNSTIACALDAKKLDIAVAHVESGLRSFDMRMPEEVNRVLTDRISDFLFTTEASGNKNLAAEGYDDGLVHFVGNVMIDSLVTHLEKARQRDVLQRLGHTDGGYVLVTIHRPSNVDEEPVLAQLVETLILASERRPLLVPLHPRTRNNLERFGLFERLAGVAAVTICEPLGYLDFLRCQAGAAAILTDSGGIQEESTYLGVPCITMRENTERPATITDGTNRLIGTDQGEILEALDAALARNRGDHPVPPLWDGKAAERIAAILLAV